MKIVPPLVVRTGIEFRAAMVAGDALVSMLNSVSPSLAVPEGSVRFCVFTALTMSTEVSPLAWSCCGSMSTEITRCLPP